MTDDEPPARPVFAGTDAESWAMFAERERRWLFDAVEWLLKKRATGDALSRPS